jgi:hypothetical protein
MFCFKIDLTVIQCGGMDIKVRLLGGRGLRLTARSRSVKKGGSIQRKEGLGVLMVDASSGRKSERFYKVGVYSDHLHHIWARGRD